MLNKPAILSFVVLVSLATILILKTSGNLPATLGTHFDLNGQCDSCMSLDTYRIFILGFTVVFPLIIILVAGLTPRIFPGSVRIPNRDFWFSKERVLDTFHFFLAHTFWLGCLLVLLALGLHWIILEANTTTPAELPITKFSVLILSFVVGVIVWILKLISHFNQRT